MLVVFPPIFVADTKTVFGYDLGVPLRLFFFKIWRVIKLKNLLTGMFPQEVVHNLRTKRFFENHEAIFFYHHQISEALVRRSSLKNFFFEIFCQILRKTPVNVFLSCSYTHCLFKKKHQHRCFL